MRRSAGVQENRDAFFFWSRFEDHWQTRRIPQSRSTTQTLLVEASRRANTARAKGSAVDLRGDLAAGGRLEHSAQHLALIVMQGVIEHEQWAGLLARADAAGPLVRKSLSSLLIGIAIGEGRIRSVDEPVATYLTEVEGRPAARSLSASS